MDRVSSTPTRTAPQSNGSIPRNSRQKTVQGGSVPAGNAGGEGNSISIFGPDSVDRFSGISSDAQRRTVVIGELARIVHRMLLHEFGHLQCAALAVDIWQGDFRFEGLICPGVMLEQPVGKYRRRDWIHDLRRNRHYDALIVGHSLGLGVQR